jgi:endonuclease/exonuclease/phosphatase family metal-dependent hydrolase
MTVISFFPNLFLSVYLPAMYSAAQIPVRILTHNIRYATGSPFRGEKPWADRKQLMLNELYFNTLHNPESFICLQEVLHNQLVDILGGLNSLPAGEWDYIGVGRNDGKEAGEYSPIIYRPAVWKVETWKTVWLSETPDRPSKGWDAASIRIVTVGIFQHRGSKRRVLAMNTHLDEQGETSRREAAKLILETVADMTADDPDLPVIFTGDLNSEGDDGAYSTLAAESSPLRDVKGLAPVKYGDDYTFTGFQGNDLKHLDYVFVGGRGEAREKAWEVRAYAVLENKFDDGDYNRYVIAIRQRRITLKDLCLPTSSDHRAVVGDMVVRG